MLVVLLGMAVKSCTRKPGETELPPATTEGLNTFGAMVNGEVWLADALPALGSPYGSDPLYGYYSPTPIVAGQYEFWVGNVLRIQAFGSVGNRIMDYDNLFLDADSIIGLGTYNFDTVTVNANGNPWWLYTAYEDRVDVETFNKIGNTNVLEITRLDTVEKIVSGTFELTLVSPSTGNVVIILDGRFDITYKPPYQ